ncbi:efflux RND transporter periplasmic adaptor subunit [Burkholderia multivorans]|uniref:efflux RND transporter periplasmic adaptor subunit n=1 Tax=Burkholderia multivorans TaxID=87883 RepID=UPI002858AF08|nr:efflux RND transporter periplasmic adaptor subunit [Burkholderia multivorans]MDR9095514.1 Cation efflux system protein CusB [Burkholderia multivorans]MDR9119293.1 Cation efflux system protein CusB [Burkholderia multivorans]MDR9158958.1 Cation efflux system protein CusB [Burkholderia multivorans]MDR9166354.1 Cation efflux system protein CusB [Burkholderia multivorans]MDR9252926.1 Cation efflux system protein CusB [Burkholderia multivorans]
MNKKTIVIALLAAVVLGTGGWSIYQLGFRNGVAHASTATPSQAKGSPAGAPIDPSNWGVPEGEAATRHHIESGLKAGDVDPITDRKILYYHDPMMPGKKFEAPGKSPFMDMMLVPVYAGAESADSGTVSISPRIQQNLGLRTGEVVSGQLVSEVSAVGTVAWNERDQIVVQARATGFVEKLHVRAALDSVRKGQALLDLYVPDWVAVQEDYLAARHLQGQGLERLADAARQRMRQAGMSEAQIALVERTGQVQARMTLLAPESGVVTELMVREGSTVMTGMPLMRINELSSVWVQAEVPESQATQVAVGAQVTAQTPAWPGEVFRGQVQSLLPEVNPTTRTRKARMVVANPKARLVPGMVVHMQLRAGQARAALLVPSESLVRTGKRTLVIAVEDGAFRPVEVQVGREQNGQAEILSGLSQGQKIVLSGQFLIDSEASLKGMEARLSTDQTPGAVGAAPQTYRTTARVEAVAGDVLTLTHPEIPALKWPGMTMDFKLAPDVSKKPSAGSEIDIEFRMREGDAPQIVQWQARTGKSAGGAQ